MDGLSLAAVESATLTQGIAFLYAQAGELLRRRREGRDQAAAREEQAGQILPGAKPLPALQLPDGVFESAAETGPVAVVPDVLDRLAGSLLQARRDVDDYVVGTAELGGDSRSGLQEADRLRCLLEEVYDAAVTFRGEQRPTAAARDQTVARVHAPHAGVVLTGNVTVTGDIAGHTIRKNS